MGRGHPTFLRDVRDFFLYKAGHEAIDSRTADALAAAIDVEIATEFPAGESLPVRATVTNRGRATWLPSGRSNGAVWLGCHLYERERRSARSRLSPSGAVDATRCAGRERHRHLRAALAPPKVLISELDCVAEHVAWFARARIRGRAEKRASDTNVGKQHKS